MSSTLASSDLEERSRSSRSGGGGARAGGGVAAEPGRDMRRIHGSQYRNTQRIYPVMSIYMSIKVLIIHFSLLFNLRKY